MLIVQYLSMENVTPICYEGIIVPLLSFLFYCIFKLRRIFMDMTMVSTYSQEVLLNHMVRDFGTHEVITVNEILSAISTVIILVYIPLF